VAFLLKPRITWQQRGQQPERQRQQPGQQRGQQPGQKRQQPEREQRREQQPEREQQEPALQLFCHKQPEQRQRSQQPERGICSFGLPNELKKTISGNCQCRKLH